jgi:integrase
MPRIGASSSRSVAPSNSRASDCRHPPKRGASPLVANVYLNRLDQAWQMHHRRLGELTRYADDLVILCATKPRADADAHRVMSLALDHAVHDGRLARNPAKGVRLPRPQRGEVVILDHDQVEDLASACGAYELLIRFLAYTGLRWGEMSALRVARVDLFRRRVHVVRAFAEVRCKLVEATPKSHQFRQVPLPRLLVGRLAEQVAGMGPDDLVFRSPAGGPLRNTNFRTRVWNRAVLQAGLRGLTPHDLRHTAASLAVAAGANVKAVQRMLGHASAAMTLDVYAGLFGDDLDAADRLDEAFASGMRTQCGLQPPAAP